MGTCKAFGREGPWEGSDSRVIILVAVVLLKIAKEWSWKWRKQLEDHCSILVMRVDLWQLAIKSETTFNFQNILDLETADKIL